MRKLTSIILLFIIAIVIATSTLISFVDLNYFKKPISTFVTQKTGLTLSINGNINLTFFPWPGIQVHQVVLGNTEINEADITVELLPLLHRRLEISKISLYGLIFHLTKNQTIELTNLQLHSKSFALGKPIQIDTRFNIIGNQPQFTGEAAFTTWVTVGSENKIIFFNKLHGDITHYRSNFYDAKQISFDGQATLNFATTGSLLQNMRGAANLTISSLDIANIHTTHVVTTINADKGLFHLAPFSAHLYQGNAQGKINLELQSDVPRFTIDQTLSDIQIEPFLKDLQESSHLHVSGNGNLNAYLTAEGNSADSIKRTLAGNIKFAVTQGILSGIDINYWLNVGSALYHKEPIPSFPNTGQTPFNHFTGTFNIDQGVAHNDDLLLQINSMRVTGHGDIDAVNQHLDYRLSAVKMNPTTGQPHEDVIPIKVTGSFNHPSIRPDIEALLVNQAKKEFNKQSEKLKEKVNTLFHHE